MAPGGSMKRAITSHKHVSSKRSRIADTTAGEAIHADDVDDVDVNDVSCHLKDNALLTSILDKVGFRDILISDCNVDSLIRLSNEPLKIRMRLHQAFSQQFGHSHNTGDVSLVDEVREFLDESSDGDEYNRLLLLRRLLLPTIFSGSSIPHDSVIKMMLGYAPTQCSLMMFLLETLTELCHASSGDQDSASLTSISTSGVNHQSTIAAELPKLLVSQFRWLDIVTSGRVIGIQMLELVPLLPLDVQHDMVACIPELVQDADRDVIVTALKEIMTEIPGLLVPILDTLDNLNLSEECLHDVRENVMRSLPAAGVDHLPVIVRFLLKNLSANNIAIVVASLRRHLEFDHFTGETARTPGKGRNDACETFTLDAIKMAIRADRAMADAWLSAIENVNDVSEHRVLDIFVLLALHTSQRYSNHVIKIFRSKIRSGLFSDSLIRIAIQQHAHICKQYFPTLLTLADVLLRSTEKSSRDIASIIYVTSFMELDSFYRQEIISAVIAHISGGCAHEINSSLKVLDSLQHSCCALLQPFAVFLKGMLDYVHNISVDQARNVFALLVALADNCEDYESLEQDDMHIVIRKLLTHTTQSYKVLGVVGIVRVIRHASMCGDTSMDKDSVEIIGDKSRASFAMNQLELACKNVNDVASEGLLYDELARALMESTAGSSFHSDVISWLRENVVYGFEKRYVVDEPSFTEEHDGLSLIDSLRNNEPPGHLWYNLDGAANEVAVDTLLAINESGNSLTTIPLANSFALFRLMQIVERTANNSLNEVDALIGCALSIVDTSHPEVFKSLPVKDREKGCLSLYFALNYLLEIINGFATESDLEIQTKVIRRLKDITDIQAHLGRFLSMTPSFVAPIVSFLPEVADIAASIHKAVTKPIKKKRSKKKSKKKPSKVAYEDDCEGIDNNTDEQSDIYDNEDDHRIESVGSIKNDEDISLQFSRVYPLLREIDYHSLLAILQYPGMHCKLTDSLMNTKETNEVVVGTEQLVFLLSDLHPKLEFLFPVAPSTGLPAVRRNKQSSSQRTTSSLSLWNSGSAFDSFVPALPNLCEKLEGALAFFQEYDDSSSLESFSLFSDHSVNKDFSLFSKSVLLLLQCFTDVIAWSELAQPLNLQRLKLFLASFGARTRNEDVEVCASRSLETITSAAFQYLRECLNHLPNRDFLTTVTLVKLLSFFVRQTNMNKLYPDLSECSLVVLKQKGWQDDTLHTGLLSYVIGVYVHMAKNPLETLRYLASEILPELVSIMARNSDDGNSQSSPAAVVSSTFPTLTENTLPIYYKSILIELCSAMTNFNINAIICANDDRSMSTMDEESAIGRQLVELSLAINTLDSLCSMIKVFEAPSILSSILRYSCKFLTAFMARGMPFLGEHFRSNKDDVLVLLGVLQHSTRILQHACGHIKDNKAIGNTTHVPPLRRCLEMLLYRVKAMLEANGCMGAWSLGNLRNRNIKGDTIQKKMVESSDNDRSSCSSSSSNDVSGEESEAENDDSK